MPCRSAIRDSGSKVPRPVRRHVRHPEPYVLESLVEDKSLREPSRGHFYIPRAAFYLDAPGPLHDGEQGCEITEAVVENSWDLLERASQGSSVRGSQKLPPPNRMPISLCSTRRSIRSTPVCLKQTHSP